MERTRGSPRLTFDVRWARVRGSRLLPRNRSAGASPPSHPTLVHSRQQIGNRDLANRMPRGGGQICERHEDEGALEVGGRRSVTGDLFTLVLNNPTRFRPEAEVERVEQEKVVCQALRLS